MQLNTTSNDLTGLLGGAGNSAGGGVSLPNLLSGAASSTSGGVSGFLGAAASGAATGALFGPAGAGIGAALGALTSLFGGHGVPNHEAGDIGRIAAAAGITDQQAADVCGYEESRSPENFDAICAKYARNPAGFATALSVYNAAHPNAQIQTQAQVATAQQSSAFQNIQAQAASYFSGTGRANPLANLTFPAAQQAAANQNMSLADYLKVILQGALEGAKVGAGTAAANTPAGEQASNEVIKSKLVQYQSVILLGFLGLGVLVYKAVKNN